MKEMVLMENIKNINEKKLKCASFFAGVGGIDLGFELAGFQTVYANEFDSNALKTYNLNFPDIKTDDRDIREVVSDLQKGIDCTGDFEILLAGFPCQAFSVAGYQEGFDDKKGRGDLFFEVMKIAKIKQPQIIFLENVKNLTTHDHGKTFKIIKDCLVSEGYHIQYKVLNTMEYGNLPQNRERIYVVAFKDKALSEKFSFPKKISLTNTLDCVIDFKKKIEGRYYYTREKYKIYDKLVPYINKENTIYQWRRVYVRENKNHVCPTLTANMGTGGHNVPLIFTEYGIRKLTPKECFALQGFPDTYLLPDDMAISHLYKQAGNSVSVTVIQRIAENIKRVLS